MPDLIEHMYCSQQINIPPNLPFILKQYAKAAIRTQPHDLLYWSAAYFRAKADNVPPPVKDRLEYPPVDSPSRLSPGFLKVLHKQLGAKEEVPVETLYEKWLGVCLVKEALDSMLNVGSMTEKVPWLKFVAIAAGHLSASLSKTMIMVCEVLTEEPDGGSAMIPVEVFVSLYQYLSRMDCSPRQSPDIPLESVTTATSVLDRSDSSVCSVIMREVGKPKDGDEGLEKDSTAGLMVWPDLKPEEQADTFRSPRYEEELGATSDTGVEVLDNATGPVQQVLTLFPVQTSIESNQTIPLPSTTSKQFQSVNETSLSHSSLKENQDWIKIKQRNLDVESRQVEGVVESTPMDSKKDDDGLEGAVEKDESAMKSEEERTDKVSMEIEEEQSADKIKETEDKDNIEEKSNIDEDGTVLEGNHSQIRVEPETEDNAVSEEKSIPTISKEEDSRGQNDVSYDQQDSQPSVDTFLEPGESVTVQHFVRDDLDGSTVTYSTGEIRKGYFGNKSELKVTRSSNENVVKAAATVHPLAMEEESSLLLPTVKVSEDKLSSRDSRSFVVLEDEWHDVPGIGPVIPEPQILAVVEYMHYWAAKQEGMVMPRNVNHILCPPLDLHPFTQGSEIESYY